MGKLGNIGIFISGTILLLTSYSFAENEADTYGMTAMSLKFLKTHEERVAAHKAKEVDKSLKQNILNTLTGTLGETMAEDILNHIEKDWCYTLDLVNTNDNDITALVLALFNKIEAYIQSWYYTTCVVYNTLITTNNFKPEYCRKLTAYFSIYCATGTPELIQKFLSVTDASLSDADKLVLQNFKKVLTDDWMEMISLTLKPGKAFSPEYNEVLKRASKPLFDMVVLAEQKIISTLPLRSLDTLKLSMLFGHLEEAALEEGFVNFVHNFNNLEGLWNKGKDLTNRLTGFGSLPGLGFIKYTIMDVMREVLIKKAEILGVNRRNEFESMKQENMKISLNDGVFTKTVD